MRGVLLFMLGLAACAGPRYRVQLDARAEARAIYARQEYLAFLANTCNAQPGRQLRTHEARLDADAARAQERDQTALQARATIQAQLVALGAKPRPAMPPPRPEEPGLPPSEDSVWVAGSWSWDASDGAWEWEDGSWSEPNMIWEASAAVYNLRDAEPTVRDHRRERTRDHRDDSTRSISSLFGSDKREVARDDKPVVRDHRGDNRGEWLPQSRSDDKKHDDDDKPIVRDHR